MASPVILKFRFNADGELNVGALAKQANTVRIEGLNFDPHLTQFRVTGGFVHFDEFEVTARHNGAAIKVIEGTFTAQGIAAPGSKLRARVYVCNGLGFQDHVVTTA